MKKGNDSFGKYHRLKNEYHHSRIERSAHGENPSKELATDAKGQFLRMSVNSFAGDNNKQIYYSKGNQQCPFNNLITVQQQRVKDNDE